MKKRRIDDKFPPFKLDKGPFKGQTVVVASQEKLNFVSDIADHFLLHVLKHPEALITDRSTIFDFGPAGKKPYEAYRKKIIARAKRIYGIDITDVFDKCLPEIFHYVESNRKR